MLLVALLVLMAYLVGSVSTAIIVCRLIGVADPRDVGSGNPGATNVLRHAGKLAAALTLLGDAFKGVAPILVAAAAGLQAGQLALVGCAAFLGHLYPIYYQLRGGKGVATFLGVALALDPWLGVGFIAIWLTIALLLRFSSLASLLAAAATPIVGLALGLPPQTLALLMVMSALIFWRHRANIRDLLAGTEKKIGQKA